MSEQKTVRVATKDETAQMLSVPAPGVNRFYVTMGPTGLRLTFAEEIEDAVAFRNAVTMHPQDGIKLYKVLRDQLKDIEVQLENLGKQAGKKDA